MDLHSQLIKLGDMMGDGLHHEPDGKWIEKEYKKICKLLGYGKPRKNNSEKINIGVAKYIENNVCCCGGKFVQTRSGSMRLKCTSSSCNKIYQLKAAKK